MGHRHGILPVPVEPRPTISRAVKVELDPTKAQAKRLAQACGVARYVYNYLLGVRKRGYAEAKAKGEKYKVPYQYGLVAEHRKTEAPWIGDVSSSVINYAIRGLDDAFSNFFASCRGSRRASPPRFKSRAPSRRTFRVQTQQACHVKGRSVQIPKVGWIRTKEDPSTRIPHGAHIASMAVVCDVDRWYVSLCLVDLPVAVTIEREEGVIGIDLNVARTVCSDGTIYHVPERLKILDKRIRRAQRVLSRRQKGSNRRQVAKVRLAKVHRTVRHVREDWLHKVTKELAHKHSRIVIEKLAVANMVRSTKGTATNPGKKIHQKAALNRAILRAAFGEFRRQLTYKSAWYGCTLTIADRWFASSKTCSCCGAKNESLTLADRIFRCGVCGLVIDRDLNAAINLSRIPAVETPQEVPAGSGELTDVDRMRPRRSKRRKPESIVEAAGTKRQHAIDSETSQPDEIKHVAGVSNLQPRKTRAGPRRTVAVDRGSDDVLPGSP
jgi:putative transposase